jgi:hypothetical protein
MRDIPATGDGRPPVVHTEASVVDGAASLRVGANIFSNVPRVSPSTHL